MKPHRVVHLAANVGGLFKNMNFKAAMFEDNLLMNTWVLKHARLAGCQRVVCLLSTCIFPDAVAMDASGTGGGMRPEQLHDGPPHPSNEGYAYAKRMMDVHAKILREACGVETVCIVPTNIYGPNDNFNLDDGHVLPALVYKAWTAKMSGTPLVVRGSGAALRQFVFSDDLAQCIARVACADTWTGETTLVCSPPASAEITIGEAAMAIAEAFQMPASNVVFDPTYPDGQARKTVAPSACWDDVVWTSLIDGIAMTVAWFQKAVVNGTARV